MERLLAIVGPTGSGKTALSLRLAKQYQGEIINVDTRQFYRDARIGTNLPPGEWWDVDGEPAFFVDGVRHHLMACLSPQEQWSVLEWRDRAERSIKAIAKRGHLPILVGGTGLYLRALLQGYALPSQSADPLRRTELSSWSLVQLVEYLQKLAPERLKTIDAQNPRRVIRAIELAETNAPLPQKSEEPLYQALSLARELSLEERHRRIEASVVTQFANGWIDEVKDLLAEGVTVNDPLMQAIGYREIASFLKKQDDLVELTQEISKKTWQYVRRQLTWFRKEPNLHWFKTDEEAFALVDAWLQTTDNTIL